MTTAAAELTCADWCIGGLGEHGDSCLSESNDRRILCTEDGTHKDARGADTNYETRVYLQRNIGWGEGDLSDAAITQVRVCVEDIGITGAGLDVGMTVEQARELAKHLLDMADVAEADREALLAAGHHVSEPDQEDGPLSQR